MRELNESPAKGHQELGWEDFLIRTGDGDEVAHGSIYVTFEVIGETTDFYIQVTKQPILDEIRKWISQGNVKVIHDSGTELKIVEN